MQWIDTHAHLFVRTQSDKNIGLLASESVLNSPEIYAEKLSANMPEACVVVDFSKAENSEHVIESLDRLKDLNIKAKGVIRGEEANINTLQWLARHDVQGVRIYALQEAPDLSGKFYQGIFEYLSDSGKHALLFGKPENLLETTRQIPADVIILIDHIGLPDNYGDDESYDKLLEVAKNRGNIYFKGPGYRTSLDISKVAPILRNMIDVLGVEKLLLGASDAPFAGPVMEKAPQYEGENYSKYMDYDKVMKYLTSLADAATDNNEHKEMILYKNAREIYGF